MHFSCWSGGWCTLFEQYTWHASWCLVSLHLLHRQLAQSRGHYQRGQFKNIDDSHLGSVCGGAFQLMCPAGGCRINVVTGEVKRTAICESQNLDHPRVNPLFYSRVTRYVYFNASQIADIPGKSGPPQVCFTYPKLPDHRGSKYMTCCISFSLGLCA
jgi:hypothetical protein